MQNHTRTIKRMPKVHSEMNCLEVAERFIAEVLYHCKVAGSLRRGIESTHDVDIVCFNSDKQRLTETKQQIRRNGCNIEVHTSHPDHYGPMMLAWTGPQGANIGMRRIATSKGMKLSEYGLFDRITNQRLDNNTEDDICLQVLNRPCKPPELR